MQRQDVERLGRKTGHTLAMHAVIGGGWFHWRGLGEVGEQMLQEAGLKPGSGEWAIAEACAKQEFESYFAERANR